MEVNILIAGGAVTMESEEILQYCEPAQLPFKNEWQLKELDNLFQMKYCMCSVNRILHHTENIDQCNYEAHLMGSLVIKVAADIF